MNIFVAIALPWLSFYLRKKWFNGTVALIFHILAFLSLFPSGLGFIIWLVLAIWAVFSYNYSQAKTKKKVNH